MIKMCIILRRTFSIFLLFHLCNCEYNSESGKLSNLNLLDPNKRIDCENTQNVLLSRKKRALTFPPGSSLQLGTWISYSFYFLSYITIR